MIRNLTEMALFSWTKKYGQVRDSRDGIIGTVEKLWDQTADELGLAEVILRTVGKGLYVPKHMVIQNDQDILDLA
jgi:hypothetical protein